MSRDERRARRQQEWAALHAALARTRGAVDQAHRESATWALLRERQRAAIMPYLATWRRQMAALQCPLSLSLWRLRARRTALQAAYGWPDLRPIVIWSRLRLVGRFALIILLWLWQRRRLILGGAAVLASLWLAIMAIDWLVSNLGNLVNAIRGIFQ